MERRILISLIAILCVHTIGTVLSWYIVFPWFDIPMHIAGGAWVAYLFFFVFEEKWGVFNAGKSFGITLVAALGFVALIGVLWEFYEYLYDVFVAERFGFASQSGRLFDTLKDLFDDLLGGTTLIWILWRSRSRLRS